MKMSSPHKANRLYGRSRGRPLGTHQHYLMDHLYPNISLDPDNLSVIDVAIDSEIERGGASQSEQEIWFEIGFGGSEHLIWQAQQNPKVTLWGAEPFVNGLAKALTAIEREDLDNIRLYLGDGRDILTSLSSESLARVFVLFPDPWSKARHHKRRLIDPEFIEHVWRVLKPGGHFRFASDIIHYVDWSLTRIKAHGGFEFTPKVQKDWRQRPDDWPSTRYLEKALREGRAGHFFEFTKIMPQTTDKP